MNRGYMSEDFKAQPNNIFISLRWHLLAFFSVIFTILYFILLSFIGNLAEEETSRQVQKDLTQSLIGIANRINVDMLIELAETGEANEQGFSDDPRYLELLEVLDEAHQVEPDAWPYLYIPADEENQIFGVVDLWAIYNPEKSFAFMESYTSNSGFIIKGLSEQTYRAVDHPYVQRVKDIAVSASEDFPWMADRMLGFSDWLAGTQIFEKREFGTYEDQFGHWVSGYIPLTNSAGEKVAAVGVDFQADTVLEVEQIVLEKTKNLFQVVYPIFLIILIILSKYFIQPLSLLAQRAEKISMGDYEVGLDTYSDRRIRDEVTELATSMSSMITRLQAREQQYRMVVTGQGDFIIRWDRQGNWTFANEIYCQALGVKHDELIGSPVNFNLLKKSDPDTRAALREEVNTLTPENSQIVIELEALISSGQMGWLQWQFSASFDANDEIIEWQGVGRDITTLKKLQIELEEANNRLKELSHYLMVEREAEYKQLARILHDDVLHYLSRVSLTDIVEEDKAWLDPETAIEQLRSLIFNLRPPMLDYGLYFAIYEYSEHLMDRAAENQKIIFEITESKDRFLSEIEAHMYRIVIQASENALKHANAATIRIGGEISPDRIIIYIEDDGDGFDYNELAGIEKLVTEKHYGLIGMKERAELINARLDIESTLNTGTSILIYWIPAVVEE